MDNYPPLLHFPSARTILTPWIRFLRLLLSWFNLTADISTLFPVAAGCCFGIKVLETHAITKQQSRQTMGNCSSGWMWRSIEPLRRQIPSHRVVETKAEPNAEWKLDFTRLSQKYFCWLAAASAGCVKRQLLHKTSAMCSKPVSSVCLRDLSVDTVCWCEG